ncbi:MAG: hypothetical protein AAGI37_18200 [Planctomycetota bacterium]
MPTPKETHRGTTLTRGIVNPTESRATMYVHVDGLTDARTQLNTAITTAIAGRLQHPDDASLPLRRATARWFRGSVGASDGAAVVVLEYDKFSGGNATDSTEFSVVADVDVRSMTVKWWAKEFPLPAVAGTPVEANTSADGRARNSKVLLPTPRYIEVPVWYIRVPVTITSSPIAAVEGMVAKVNDASFTISNKPFAANTLRFDGVSQRTSKIDDGETVTYEFDIAYLFAVRFDGWYQSDLVDDNGEYKADKSLMYESTTFSDPPTS